ncbi:DUF2971 domain-containing protein [Burkholderia glumae]
MDTKRKTPTVVYHYCGADAFLNILEKGRLWVSDARKTNDRRELEWFKGLAFAHLDSHSKRDEKLKALYVELDLHFGLIEGISDYYVCCFSEDRDSVPQWSAYADRGAGFAIGFDVNALRMAVGAPLVDSNYSIVPNEKSSDEWGFGPVFYGEEGVGGDQLDHLMNLIDLNSLLDLDAAKSAREYIDRVCAFCKHPGFVTEREWRIVHNASLARKNAGSDGEPPRDTRWRKGAYGLTPYRETPNIAHCVREVVIGPANVDRGAQEHVSQFLKFAGVDAARVSLSESPYR